MPVRKLAKRKTKASAAAQEAAMPKPVGIVPMDNKLRQPKVLIGLIVVILIVAAFLLKGLFIAALVNGEPISRLIVISELEKQSG